MRNAISAESGFNDGLALPFVAVPILVLTEPPGETLGHCVTHTVLVEITAGSNDAKERQEDIQEAISRFFDLPIFVLLGMSLPWEGWIELGWTGLLLVAAVLLLRRLPAVLALKPLLGSLCKGYDILFLEWFGSGGALLRRLLAA